jgi:RHS repeat-associated protein
MRAKLMFVSLAGLAVVPLLGGISWFPIGRAPRPYPASPVATSSSRSGVTVTPVPLWSPQRLPSTGPWTATFWVKNTTTSGTYTFFCDGSPSPPITCSGNPSPATALINTGDSVSVTLTYNVGSYVGNANGFVSLTAEGPGVGSGNQNVPVGTGGALAIVTPDAGAATVPPFIDSSQVFTVQNSSTFPVTFTLSAACTGAGVKAGCAVSLASATLDGGASTTDTVTFQSKANGTTGKVALFASEGGQVKDSGWVNLTVGGTGGTQMAPVVNIVNVNSGTTIARELCLTASLGPGAASECGDLRLAHGFQALKTLGVSRAPVLLYGSQTAEPSGNVAVLVSLPSGALVPDFIEAILKVGGVRKDSARWTGSEWMANRQRRLMLRDTTVGMATGVYAYTVDVSSVFGGSKLGAPQVNSSFVTVNRQTTHFGKGWWIAGFEKLQVSSSILWIGGDGSTRLYQAAGTDKWVAPNLTRPDTLLKSGIEYWRLLPEKGKVVFDLNGRHIRTENRLGYSTQFTYSSVGDTLKSITAPIPSGGAPRVWSFTYTPTGNPTLITISDGIGGTPRLLKIHLGTGRVDSLVDPDTSRVGFTYLSGTSGLITTRKDRRNFVRTFTLDTKRHVTGASIDPGFSQQLISLSLKPLESVGFACGTSPCSADTTKAYALIDGARTDVGDSTRYYLDKYGAPLEIKDAFGRIAKITRDTIWPALVSKAVYPNGRITRATYNGRGNLASLMEDSATVLGRDSQSVATSYSYGNASCPDNVTGITLPGANGPSFTYNSTNCNRLTETDGAGNQVIYTYWTTGSGKDLLASIQAPGITGKDSLFYDGQGNLRKTKTPRGIVDSIVNDGLGRDSVRVSPTDSLQTAAKMFKQIRLYDRQGRAKQTDAIAVGSSYWDPLAQATDTVGAITTTTTSNYDKEANLLQTQTIQNPDSTAMLHRTTYQYDNAGRLRYKEEGGAGTTLVRDPAGNLISSTNGRGQILSMSYNALNQLVKRITPQVDYTQEACVLPCLYPFPYYPNNGTGLRIAADTATFSYDVVGNLLTANNSLTQVKRSWTKTGWLKTDSLRLRNYAGTTFLAHIYGLTIRYDSLGRRRVLKHPSALRTTAAPNSTRDSVVYVYNAGTGALSEVRDLSDRRYNYIDDPAGRQVRLDIRQMAGGAVGVADSLTWDADSRLVARRVNSWVKDSMWYDARGKLLRVNHIGLNTWGDVVSNLAYSGQGPLVASFPQYSSPPEAKAEETRVDGLGNAYHRQSNHPDEQPQRLTYSWPSGRLIQQVASGSGPFSSNDWYPDSTGYTYDGSGNLRSRFRHTYFYLAGVASWEEERHWYGADDKLRYLQRNAQAGSGSAPTSGAWEEYWYDALGRRVLRRERRNELSSEVYKRDILDRYVSDGEQLLYEIRIRGGVSDPLDATSYSGSKFHGTVGYLHGRNLDLPLALIDTLGQIPIADWRNQYEGSVSPAGVRVDCTSSPSLPGCWQIEWSGRRVGTRLHKWGLGSDLAWEWRGSLVEDQRDKAGVMYRRNRYYDPESGKFTQVDPVGIAGGLNVYGFANGDPVNFSDPFGLCPVGWRDSSGNCPGGLSVKEWNRTQEATDEMGPASARRTRGLLAKGRIHGGDLESNVYGRTSDVTGTDITINRRFGLLGSLGIGGSVFNDAEELTSTLLHEGKHVDQLNSPKRGTMSFRDWYLQNKGFFDYEAEQAERIDRKERP